MSAPELREQLAKPWDGKTRTDINSMRRLIQGIAHGAEHFESAFVELAALRADVERKDEELRSIKDMVCGDRHPRWSHHVSTTNMREHIADACDRALAPAQKEEHSWNCRVVLVDGLMGLPPEERRECKCKGVTVAGHPCHCADLFQAPTPAQPPKPEET